MRTKTLLINALVLICIFVIIPNLALSLREFVKDDPAVCMMKELNKYDNLNKKDSFRVFKETIDKCK
jgi:hypothetical protein